MYSKLNEEIKIKNNKKLRDAIHDIVTSLEKDEYFDVVTISNILRYDYNIILSPNLLVRFIVYWTENKDSIFNSSDNKWLSWDNDEQIIENNIVKIERKSKLGKSRRKLIKKESEDRLKTTKQNGWRKIKDGRFIYYGIKSFNITNDDEITITIYEKEKYKKNENPIPPELIKKIFILDHPNDANKFSNIIQNDIKMNKIVSNPNNGNFYYDECFKLLFKISEKYKLDVIKGWDKKYAPSLLKKRIIRRKKRKEYEKEQETKSFKTIIKDRDKALKELEDIIDINKKYFILLTKYDKIKNIFLIKKILYNYITISENKNERGNYTVTDIDNIIYFDTMSHFKRALDGGIKDDEYHVYNIIPDDKDFKIKIFFDELKKYKNWDEFLDKEIINKLKNDF